MASVNLYDISVPQHIHMLKSLSAILDKVTKQTQTQTPASTLGADKPLTLDNLAESRIAPDMKPFPYQVMTACNSAKLCAVRVADVPNAEHADTQTTIPELQERIKTTVSFLESLKSGDYAGKETKEIELHGYKFTGATFITQFSLPNFYFHVTCAYAILRGLGFDVGKLDFLGASTLERV